MTAHTVVRETRPDDNRRPATTPSKRRPWGLLVLSVTVSAMVVYLLSAYVPPEIANSRIPISSQLQYVLLVAHIFTASVAAMTGLAQLWPWLRNRYPVVHRWTGRAYFFLGVFPSSILAVPVLLMAPLGMSNQASLAMLDVLWMGTAVAGYRSARQRRFADHRKWMIRNFALTFASLTSRFWTPIMAMFIPVATTHGIGYQGDPNGVAVIHDIASSSAWLGLVVNMVIAEWYIQRRYGVPKSKRVAAAADQASRSALAVR